MKIVILNDSFFTEQHIEELRSLGEVNIFANTADTATAIERTGDADVVLGDAYLVDFNEEYFASVPKVKMLALNTIGYTMVDMKAAAAREVMVSNVPGFSKYTVAEFSLGLILDVVRRISYGDRKFRAAPFEPDPTAPEGKEFIGFELRGKTLGIVGLGQIGTEIASLGEKLGMSIVAWNRRERPGVQVASLEEVMACDVVVVSVVSSEETKGLISRSLLGRMQPHAGLVSISRPDVIENEALINILKEKKIRGAALDMSGVEQYPAFLELENVVLTPHIGSYTEEAFYENLPNRIVENVKNFAAGSPTNVVS